MSRRSLSPIPNSANMAAYVLDPALYSFANKLPRLGSSPRPICCLLACSALIYCLASSAASEAEETAQTLPIFKPYAESLLAVNGILSRMS
nr:MAG TPA: hypothetical protein [Caudoviricetes sp.]